MPGGRGCAALAARRGARELPGRAGPDRGRGHGLRARAAVIAAVGLALNVALNALLVPRHGIDGAAAATLATEAWVAAGALLALRRAGVGLRGVFLRPR